MLSADYSVWFAVPEGNPPQQQHLRAGHCRGAARLALSLVGGVPAGSLVFVQNCARTARYSVTRDGRVRELATYSHSIGETAHTVTQYEIVMARQ